MITTKFWKVAKVLSLMGLIGISQNMIRAGADDKDQEVRKKFEESVNAQLTELKQKVGELEKQRDAVADTNIKNSITRRIETMKQGLSDTENKFNELKKTIASDWNKKKDEVEASMNDIKGKVQSELERRNYEGQVNEKLQKINAKLDSLSDKASKLKGKLKKEAEEELNSLKAHSEKLKLKFDEFRLSTDMKWDKFKEDIEAVFNDLVKSFKDLF